MEIKILYAARGCAARKKWPVRPRTGSYWFWFGPKVGIFRDCVGPKVFTWPKIVPKIVVEILLVVLVER